MPFIRFSRRAITLLVILIIALCALAASALIGWNPDVKGLPPDISAVQEPNRTPLELSSPLPRQIRPNDLKLD